MRFHVFEDMERENKSSLVARGFARLEVTADVPVLESEWCFPGGIIGRIDRGTANLYDFAFMKEMLERTWDYMAFREEYSNKHWQKDVSIARSLLQGIRVSLHLRGLTEFEAPHWNECPDEIRNGSFGDWEAQGELGKYQRFFACKKIVARRRKLGWKYRFLQSYPDLSFGTLFEVRIFRFYPQICDV